MNIITYLLTKQEVTNSNLIALFLWGVTMGLIMCYFMLKLRGF